MFFNQIFKILWFFHEYIGLMSTRMLEWAYFCICDISFRFYGKQPKFPTGIEIEKYNFLTISVIMYRIMESKIIIKIILISQID